MAWHKLAQENFRREQAIFFTILMTVHRGKDEAVKALARSLGVEMK